MRFFKSFRLIHRRTKSEGDVPALLPLSSSPAPLKPSRSTQHVSDVSAGHTHGGINNSSPFHIPGSPISSFHPEQLYSPFQVPWPDPYHLHEVIDTFKLRTFELEAELRMVKKANITMKFDLDVLEDELSSTRDCHYREMVRIARLQRQNLFDIQQITKLESRFNQLTGLLHAIGLSPSDIVTVCEALEFSNENAEDFLVNAIKAAVNQPGTPLATIKPIIVGPRTPEHYRSALTMTLSTRRELKSSRKTTKFWKKLAREDGRYADLVTPSSSDISSVHELLSPQREDALKALIARRQQARELNLSNGELGSSSSAASDTRLSAITIQLSTNARRSMPTHVSTSSSNSVSSSTSTAHLPYLASLPQIASQSIKEELASRTSTYVSRPLSFSRPTKPPVLGEVDTNVTKFVSNNAWEVLDERVLTENQEAAGAMVSTSSQDLNQNKHNTSLNLGHRRNTSVSSQRSSRSNRSSYRLSTASPVRFLVSAVTDALTESVNVQPERTMDSGHSRRSSDISDSSLPFDNSVFHSLLFGANSNSSSNSPLIAGNNGGFVPTSVAPESRFIEHVGVDSTRLGPDPSMSTSTINSPGLSPCLSGINEESKESLFNAHDTPTTGPTTPSKTPPGSTPTKSSRLPVLKHFRRLSMSTPTPEALLNKFRSRTFGTPSSEKARPRAASDSPRSPTAGSTKPSSIPIMNRRLTLVGRKLSISSKRGTNKTTP
ncbi:hypothetical protein SERLADRAFT_436993 [Serpula lacrymans var. lacrymans S7.9]|uniref:Uncharacterized protein n=2 Tax=Serpula lacrymans var. lacrymans TaxID=341189 RepID=F8NUL3_SERL9|nr:uncharacterized protein SERLADRAFT_436993 [Serpula lacrymans var. lacrymans S7.9]EGO25233.1 hypothetical protein SERLADRAFT_436993 [Serpula lacrymans var. lacrymans S7.9]